MAHTHRSRTSAYLAVTTATIALTVVLIGLGAVVRTTGSGLGCPDWPLCHGGVTPFQDRAAMIEWSHRLLASVVGLLIATVAVWTVLRSRRGWTVVWALHLLGLLALQVFVGREIVLRELPSAPIGFHLITALTMVALLSWAAVAAWSEARPPLPAVASPIRSVGLLSSVAVAFVVLAGILVVASDSGVACATWPGCNTAPLPFLDGEGIQHVQWAHRLMVGVGLLVILAQIGILRRLEAPRRLGVIAAAIAGLYLTQIVVGALNVWWLLPTEWRTVHVLLASSIWTLAIVHLALLWRTPVLRQEARREAMDGSAVIP